MDNIGLSDEIGGTTNITVVQPTVEGGCALPVGENRFFSPTIAFGYEINVVTEGEPTGEGAILLLGFTFGRRW